MKELLLILAASSVVLLSGCAGSNYVKRLDAQGNEVAFIQTWDTSRVDHLRPSLTPTKNAAVIVSGAAAGTSLGAGVGLGFGAVAGAMVSAVKDAGKIKFAYRDNNFGTEQDVKSGGLNLLEGAREPWPGWDELKANTWARVARDDKGVYLVPCKPECSPVADSTGRYVKRKEALVWDPKRKSWMDKFSFIKFYGAEKGAKMYESGRPGSADDPKNHPQQSAQQAEQAVVATSSNPQSSHRDSQK